MYLMIMYYSLDFRKHVFKIKEEEGLTYEYTSKRFAVSIRSLFRWKNRIEPKTKHDRPAIKVDMEALEKDVLEHPDKFQHERAKELGVSKSAICYALKRLKISYKKNIISS